jgi:hypothetical protein
MKLPPIIHLFEVTADLRSGLRGRRRTYLTIQKRAWSGNFKMLWYVLRLLRPEIRIYGKIEALFSKHLIKILFDKFDKFFEKWTLSSQHAKMQMQHFKIRMIYTQFIYSNRDVNIAISRPLT